MPWPRALQLLGTVALAFLLCAPAPAHAREDLARVVRAKAELTKRLITERAVAGQDVTELVAKAGEVAEAGETGQLARANRLLDELLVELREPEPPDKPPEPAGPTPPGRFAAPRRVEIASLPPGSGDTPISTEEPFVSRDGRFLFFNTAQHEGNKDLHYAERDGAGWVYRGQIGPGINEPGGVQGNPTMDADGRFYFVDSTVDPMLRGGRFDAASGRVSDVRELSGVPEKDVKLFRQRVHGNMGIEVTANGDVAFFSRATFRLRGIAAGPIAASDLLFARRQGDDASFAFDAAQAERVMARINTDDLEYAASISEDGLELFFTRLPRANLGRSPVRSQIMRATRPTRDAAFGEPELVEAIGTADFVEGPAISPDGQTLVYHKREGDKFRLWAVTRALP